MSDVTMYNLESQLRTLEYRLKTLEQFHKDELERQHRRSELGLKLMLWVPMAFAVILWTVLLTLEAAGK